MHVEKERQIPGRRQKAINARKNMMLYHNTRTISTTEKTYLQQIRKSKCVPFNVALEQTMKEIIMP